MKLKHFIMPDFDLEPISDHILHGPVTPEMLSYLRESNEAKRQQSIAFLGRKWLLHPDNMMHRSRDE